MEWIGQLALSVITGAVASWVAVQLSLRRFYQEKWWEQKFAAYSAVLEALHDINRTMSREAEKIGEKGYSLPSDEFFTAPIDRLWRAMDMGELLVSREMVEHLNSLWPRFRAEARDEREPRVVAQATASVARNAIPRAVELAKKDLRLAPWKWPSRTPKFTAPDSESAA